MHAHTNFTHIYIYIYNSLAYFQDVFVLEFGHDQHLSPAECRLFCREYLAMVVQLKKTRWRNYVKKAKKQKSILQVLGKILELQHNPA